MLPRTTHRACRLQEEGETEKKVLYKHNMEAGSKFPNIQDKRRW